LLAALGGFGMAVTRRTFLLAVLPGLVATVTRPAAASVEPLGSSGGYVPAPELGIAPANSGATNRANLVAALSNSAVSVLFPPGDYRIDNGGTDVVVADYAGELAMQSGARLLFTDNTRRGLVFRGGTGARLYGLATAFASPPASRQTAQECVTFDTSSDPYLENVRIDGSAAAGLLFWRCVRPTVSGATIANTMADGLHFANCRDGRADHITTVDTGDDGVAFVNYASGPANTGGLATDISVTRSKSRGVAVVGQSGVTVRDVTVDTTVGHGLYCAFEAAWNTRVPTDVRFERARVYRGGQWTAAAGGGSNSGLRVSDAGTVTLDAITVEEPGAHGAFVSRSTATLRDVNVRSAPASGCNLQGGTYVVERLVAEQTNGIGFTASNSDRVEYGTITLRNTARTHATHRAVNVENVAYVLGGRLWVHDTQQPATGYVVGAFGTQRGTLGTIVDLVDSRGVVVDNPSGLSHTLI
jgi:hypothetical protein